VTKTLVTTYIESEYRDSKMIPQTVLDKALYRQHILDHLGWDKLARPMAVQVVGLTDDGRFQLLATPIINDEAFDPFTALDSQAYTAYAWLVDRRIAQQDGSDIVRIMVYWRVPIQAGVKQEWEGFGGWGFQFCDS